MTFKSTAHYHIVSYGGGTRIFPTRRAAWEFIFSKKDGYLFLKKGLNLKCQTR